jgi:hypothetical protein
MLIVVVVAVVLALVVMTVRLSPRNDHFLESDGFIHDPMNSPRSVRKPDQDEMGRKGYHPQDTQDATESVDPVRLGVPPARRDQGEPGQGCRGDGKGLTSDLDHLSGKLGGGDEGQGEGGEHDGHRSGTGGESGLTDQRTQRGTGAPEPQD